MKYITFSRTFPKGHPKEGQPTYFVEKIWKSIWDAHEGASNPLYPWWEQYDQAFPVTGNIKENIHEHQPKHHTIRSGARFKPGETVSLRVWSGLPYRSKQIEFAQVEVKKVWEIEIYQNKEYWQLKINGYKVGDYIIDFNIDEFVDKLAKNDGLATPDFIGWFSIHPKKKEQVFKGQVICWNDKIEY